MAARKFVAAYKPMNTMLMPDTMLIGLRGPKRVGKNYTSELLLRLLPKGYSFAQFGFADALKEEVCRALGITQQEINGPRKEYYRPMLQWWGMWRREHFGVDYWVNQVKVKLKQAEKEAAEMGAPSLFTITDVRFFNEAALVKTLGGRIWDIQYPADAKPATIDPHPSEVEMDLYPSYDAVLVNDRRIPNEIYAAQLKALLTSYGLRQ